MRRVAICLQHAGLVDQKIFLNRNYPRGPDAAHFHGTLQSQTADFEIYRLLLRHIHVIV